MGKQVRNEVISLLATVLEAQLQAVLAIQNAEKRGSQGSRNIKATRALSHVQMAYDVLEKCGHPMHVVEILEHIEGSFSVSVDRDSLVSSLSKRVARGDRFERLGKNVFAIRAGVGG